MIAGARKGRALVGLALWLAASALMAQPAPAPVANPAQSERRIPGEAPVLQQQRVGIAYREAQQAAFELKLAEQDVMNTQEAYNQTSKRAAALKTELEQAIKAREAAKAKEAAARQRYDDALNAVPR